MFLIGISLSVHATHRGGGNHDDAQFNPRANIQVRGRHEDLLFPRGFGGCKRQLLK